MAQVLLGRLDGFADLLEVREEELLETDERLPVADQGAGEELALVWSRTREQDVLPADVDGLALAFEVEEILGTHSDSPADVPGIDGGQTREADDREQDGEVAGEEAKGVAGFRWEGHQSKSAHSDQRHDERGCDPTEEPEVAKTHSEDSLFGPGTCEVHDRHFGVSTGYPLPRIRGPRMNSRIPEATVDEILRRCDLVDVMGRYVQLRRTGRKYVALCPFHQEKTPSLHVDPEKGLWHCFGCKVGGTVLTFVQMMEGLNFREVALKMAAEVGIQVEISREAAAEDSQRERAFNLLDRVAGYYHELLLRSPLGQPGREYLAERRISRETAERFRLGWAPEGGRALARKLEQAGFSTQESLEAGVLVERSSGLRDLLRHRLVFPICDTQGRVLAFGGRALGDAQPKYLNSPESAFYSKRMHLYGIHLARGPISRGDQAVLVEGYFDVVSLHQAGLPRAVASLGTALTPEQANLLHRYTRTAVLAYDSDPAGQQATLKGAEILEEAGLRVLVATMPEGEDPDSLARKDPGALTEQIAAAVGVVEFQMDCLQRRIDLSTPEGKEDFVREVLPSIGRIRDSARQDAYVRRLAYRTGISEQRLHWRLRRGGRKPEPARHRARVLDVEERLLHLCATNPEWIAVVRESISVEMISRQEMRPLFSALLGLGERTEPVTLAEFLPHLQEEGMVSRLTEILAQEPLQSTLEDVRKLAVSIRDRALRERLEVLREEVLPALDAGRLDLEDPLCQEYFQLRRHFHGRAMQ